MWKPVSRGRRESLGPAIPAAEITNESTYLGRRAFLRGSAALGVGAAMGGCFTSDEVEAAAPAAKDLPPELEAKTAPRHYRTEEPVTPWDAATTYNNYYEFGTGKSDPAENAHTLEPEPWSVAIEGEVAKPGVIGLEDLVKPHALEERIYRHRCVEAWSMVIPWIGIPLGELLKRFEPTSKAKYVYFETLYDEEQMPLTRRGALPWPYREGLRMDEAMHPLTILAVGLYGRELPNQNGAPLRLVVPWKYGFKGAKSIVKIRLQERRPRTTWESENPREYGFFANVNPQVDHPRWSQRRERRIGEWTKRPTLFLNGYDKQVGSLYASLDLRRNY